MSISAVTDTSQNKSTHYEPLGGGRVALLPPVGNFIKPLVGDFVSQQKTAPMNYQVYQLAGVQDVASIDTDGEKGYIDMGPLANLDYNQSISIISMYTTTTSAFGSSSNGYFFLTAEYPYIPIVNANRRFIATVNASALAGVSAGVKGQIDGTTIAQAEFGPLPNTSLTSPLPAQPRLYWRWFAAGSPHVAPTAGAAFAYVINVMVVPAPRAADLS